MNHTTIRRWDIARAEAPVTETFDQFLWQGEQHLGDGSVLVGNMLRRTLSGVNSARASFVKKGCLYFLYPSMQPTLEPGDIILVDTWAYQQRSPQEKDVVIFHHKSNNQWLVKRIGTWPNGKLTNNGEYFMLGDNAKASQDSRFFGGVGSERLAGKVKLVLLAINHKRQLQSGRYLQSVN